MMMFYSFLWLNCATTSLVLHTETADVRKPCFKNHKCSCDEATPLVKNASIKQIFTCEEHAGPFCLAEAKLTNRYQTLTLNNLHERSEFSILHYFFFKFWFCSIFKIRKKITQQIVCMSWRFCSCCYNETGLAHLLCTYILHHSAYSHMTLSMNVTVDSWPSKEKDSFLESHHPSMSHE